MVCLLGGRWCRSVIGAAGWSGGSPFTVSTSDQACRCPLVGVGVWVWLGGTLLLLVRTVPGFWSGTGLARCWVLRRHRVVCVLGTAPGSGV